MAGGAAAGVGPVVQGWRAGMTLSREAASGLGSALVQCRVEAVQGGQRTRGAAVGQPRRYRGRGPQELPLLARSRRGEGC